jgi:hypothetical protein
MAFVGRDCGVRRGWTRALRACRRCNFARISAHSPLTTIASHHALTACQLAVPAGRSGCLAGGSELVGGELVGSALDGGLDGMRTSSP